MQKQQIETELQGLIDLGKKRGYLTIDKINKVFPDEMSPESLEEVLLKLDEAGIELLDEAEAEERRAEEQENEDDSDGNASSPATEKTALAIEKIDDPVRMYLTQMGEIPLLSRDTEIRLAKKIEFTRRRFRKKTLESCLASDAGLDIILRVMEGRLAFDRTLKVPGGNDNAKIELGRRIGVNHATVQEMVHRNRKEYATLIKRDKGYAKKHLARVLRRLADRRRKWSVLLEEMCIQTKKFRAIIEALRSHRDRMVRIEKEIASLGRKKADLQRKKELELVLRDLKIQAGEDDVHLT